MSSSSSDRSESVTMPCNTRPGNMDTPPTAGTQFPTRPVKPKVKDPHKRDMTYEEKLNLSTNLQNLPPEKMDSVIRIINKRNTVLNPHNGWFEVDIDGLDSETLWELDRFVTNYIKYTTKYKRIETANQARVAASKTVFATVTMRRDSVIMPSRTRPRHGNMDTAHTVQSNDPHIRDMTSEEKQRLSSNLRSLPLEKKLDAVVQVVNRRNNDEIEVDIDIDSVDSDTLWELDRFVIDYKRNADRARQDLVPKSVLATNPAPPATEDPPAGGDINAALVRVRIGDNASPSSTDVRQDVLMFDGEEER